MRELRVKSVTQTLNTRHEPLTHFGYKIKLWILRKYIILQEKGSRLDCTTDERKAIYLDRDSDRFRWRWPVHFYLNRGNSLGRCTGLRLVSTDFMITDSLSRLSRLNNIRKNHRWVQNSTEKCTEKHWPTSLIDNSIENIYPHNSYAYIWLKEKQVTYLIIWQQYLTINQQREIISKNNNENSLIQAVKLSEERKNKNSQKQKKRRVRAKSAKNMKNLSSFKNLVVSGIIELSWVNKYKITLNNFIAKLTWIQYKHMEYIIDNYQNLLDWPITEKELMDKDTDKYINQNVCLYRRFNQAWRYAV